MAIFSKKEKKEVAPAKNAAPVSVPKETKKKDTVEKGEDKKAKKAVKGAGVNLTKAPGYILKAPRITEKAVYMTVNHVYVFEVAPDATKRDVLQAVKALYDVTPRKINIVNKKSRAYVARFRNRVGTTSGMKKAYVFLNKGDKIDLA